MVVTWLHTQKLACWCPVLQSSQVLLSSQPEQKSFLPQLFCCLPLFLFLDGLQPVVAAPLPVEHLAVSRRGEVGILFVPGRPPVPGVDSQSLQDQLLLLGICSPSLSYHVCSAPNVNHILIFRIVLECNVCFCFQCC